MKYITKKFGMSTIYNRIEQLAIDQGFKSINSFALEGLGWNSSQKLQRLKNPKNSPSVDILLEIANKFEVDLHYLIMGENYRNVKKSKETELTQKNVNEVVQSNFDQLFKIVLSNGLMLDEIKSLLEEKVKEGES